MKKDFLILLVLLFGYMTTYAQTGITIGPPRVYFTADAGQSQTEKITVSNPSKDYTMELAVSYEDWQYSAEGENILFPKGTLATSVADWLSTSETYFQLKPGESKDLFVTINIPSLYQAVDSVPVKTGMLYVTQLNPRQGVDQNGANIRIAIRSGIKVYQRSSKSTHALIDLVNIEYIHGENKGLLLSYNNNGTIWADGQISVEILNPETGEKSSIAKIPFYSMPFDQRKQFVSLPADFKKGSYIASFIVSYGDKNLIKVGELEFDYEGE